MSQFSLYIIILALFSIRVLGENKISRASQLREKLKETKIVKRENDQVIEAINIRINQCDSYPYYNEKESSASRIIDDIKIGLIEFSRCFEKKPLPHYVESKWNQFYKLLVDANIEKYITCNFEASNSYIAVSTENKDSKAIKNYPTIKGYPGLILNTNRMAGNFPIDMNEVVAERMFNFFSGKIPRKEILPAKRNPFYSYTSNPKSLVVHEMFHWTNTIHNNSEFPDIVYLSQACCFEHLGIGKEIREKACGLLFDKELYRVEREKRLKAIEEAKIKDFVNRVNKGLHSTLNKNRHP
jgi:hypothetical protein